METLTLITALERIWKASSKSKLSEELFDIIKEETSFVGNMLQISPIQSVLLSVILDNGNETSLKKIGEYLDCSNIKMMCYEPELNDMHRRWMLQWLTYQNSTNGRCNYAVREELLQAIKQNNPFVPPVFSEFTAYAVLNQMGKWLRMIDADKSLFAVVYESMIDLLKNTRHLSLSQILLNLNLNNKEMIVLISALWNLVENNKRTLKSSDFQKYWRAPWMVIQVIKGINDGTSQLAVKHLMENEIEEGIAKPDLFKLTNHAIKTMLHDTDCQLKECVIGDNTGMNILQPNAIAYKPLYYNEREENSIHRLKHLLEQEQFKKIQKQLTEKNMRKGFTCLFYGSPGTGKTETALQLSKETGRSVIMVDAAELKSKWFGESEKQIKQLFSDYEELVKSYDVCPILLFNEADAVINKRATNVEDVCSKIENTCQNIIMQAMETFSGILIATTNLTENMDTAFERRFLYKIKFEKPCHQVRQKMWQSMIPELTANDALMLSQNYDFSGGQIENIARKTIIDSILFDFEPSLFNVSKLCQEERVIHSNNHPIGFR